MILHCSSFTEEKLCKYNWSLTVINKRRKSIRSHRISVSKETAALFAAHFHSVKLLVLRTVVPREDLCFFDIDTYNHHTNWHQISKRLLFIITIFPHQRVMVNVFESQQTGDILPPSRCKCNRNSGRIFSLVKTTQKPLIALAVTFSSL